MSDKEFFIKVLKLIHCVILGVIFTKVYASGDIVTPSEVDFIHYHAELEPNFKSQSLNGTVAIEFVPKSEKLTELNFKTQSHKIESVKLNENILHYTLLNNNLHIAFQNTLEKNRKYLLSIKYSAAPKRGMKFYEDHLFTYYHTKNWLISHIDIADKATFELSLIHDKNMQSVGNGRLVSKKNIGNNKVVSRWFQHLPIPIYIFGFALGDFREVAMSTKDIDIRILLRKQEQSQLSPKNIRAAFGNVHDMYQFFKSKAGFSTNQKKYTYVTVEGYMAQEASGFSLVGEKFVHTVLENKHENWFIAHELAHEWWGNSITCANFSHFWLNEGLVQFLVAAYKQYLFGEQAYRDEIKLAVKRVEKAIKENRVSPVAFHKPINEEAINRTMTYSKGALVFYMLREKLGNKLFWKALKEYSMTYENKSVTTQDLMVSFEKSTKKNLNVFFKRWVYGNEIPKIDI